MTDNNKHNNNIIIKEITVKNNYLFNSNNSVQSEKLPKIQKSKEYNWKTNYTMTEKNAKSKIQNLNYLEIETMIKNTNKNTLKKYSNDLDKRIKYLKYMNSQKYDPDKSKDINDAKKKYYISENDKLKYHPTGESTFDNSENRNYIQTEFDNSTKKSLKQKSEKLYEEIIKKNIPNNIYHKHRNKNMCFKLKKNPEKTIKNSLETIHSKEDINLNYKKFRNAFLIINDSISITTNSKIKNTNNCFLKLLSFLNNNEILKIFQVNREIRSCIIGCLAYKVKEKILPDFNHKYCNDFLFNNEYNFMILSKSYRKKKLHIRFILTIKPKISKVNTNLINKTIKIGFMEYINNKYNKNKSKSKEKDKKKDLIQEQDKEIIKVKTSYVFEVIEKLKPKNFWVFRENTTFHYDENSKAYNNSIIQFWPGDKALININLISEIGIIDFDNFVWNEPKMAEIATKNDINKCEVEEIINEWNKISLLENGDIVKKNLNELFANNFIIKEISYDDVGYYFFKIILKAYKIGMCNGKDGNLGIKINIFPINSSITNEIKKNGLIFDENNELAINVGDIITFYISQNKN